jgi:glycerophosphoryl diester phosphodiesterase
MTPSPLFALLATACFCAMSHATEIIAHRGASHDAPENTLASLRLGWEQGADAGELDIHMTKDGQIVLIHDATTKRNIGVDQRVDAQTLAELQTLDAGAWKGAQWKGEKLPTLADALATIPDGKRMFIEIKCEANVLPELERVIKASGKKPEQLAIIAFDYETAEQAKKLLPSLRVYWLASYKADKKTGELPQLETLIAKTKAAGLDGLDLDHKFPIDAAFFAKIKAAGLGFYVWTVNDAEIAKRLIKSGVDGVTTDRPAWLREHLK